MTNEELKNRRESILQSDFPAKEFSERRAKIMDAIGSDAKAIIKGATLRGGFDVFRQSNEFYYLCGIEVPHAYLLMDGSSRKTSLYLPERTERQERSEGVAIGAQDGDLLMNRAGVDQVANLDRLETDLNGTVKLFTCMTPGEGEMMCQDTLREAREKAQADPWDRRPTSEEHFAKKLTARLPGIQLEDLFPIIEALRIIKSPNEIELMRTAGQITSRAVNAAIRSTRPRMKEFELGALADFEFKKSGARGGAYRPIIAGGKNIWHSHYYRNDGPLQDGDLVLMDYAPDYRYYSSDIGRMWPVNGKYSPLQRLMYGWMVEYHKVLLTKIRPGVTAEAIESEAAEIMEQRLGALSFDDPEVENGFQKTLETKHLTHGVGMAVHDSGNYRTKPLEPGVVIALDPQLWVPEQKIYVRVEDTVVVTDDGVENLTSGSPLELDEVEALMTGNP